MPVCDVILWVNLLLISKLSPEKMQLFTHDSPHASAIKIKTLILVFWI